MLDLEARFSPRIIPASTNYPYGELKPNTSTGSNDGTPVTAAVGNDIEGFKQAAIKRANITPSGVPDNAVESQLLNALDKRYLEQNKQSWTATTGGTLTDASQVFLNDITASAGKGNYYAWTGTFPKVVAAGADPAAIAGFVMRSDAWLRSDLASDESTVEIGKSTAGIIGLRVSQFATDGEITGSNDASAAAAVSVNGIRTTINRHAFEDWTQLNTTDSNLGYCSFDAQPIMRNANNQDHFVGYQSRMIYEGSGNITGYCHGYTTQIQHHGSGHISNVVGFSVANPTITNGGTIGEVVGLLIQDLNNGTTSNYAIYTVGNTPSHLEGPLELASSITNSTIRQNTGWLWTDNGAQNGVKRGGFYVGSNGQFHFFTGTFDDALVGNSAGVQAKKDFTAEAKFACNGASPQGKAAVNPACTDLATAVALINQLRAALIANGICV